jgi:hypothetical protein
MGWGDDLLGGLKGVAKNVPGLSTAVGIVEGLADGDTISEIATDAVSNTVGAIPVVGGVLEGMADNVLGTTENNTRSAPVLEPASYNQPLPTTSYPEPYTAPMGQPQVNSPPGFVAPPLNGEKLPPLYAYPSTCGQPKSCMKPGLIQRSVSFGGSCSPCGQNTAGSVPALTIQQQSEVQELGCYTKCCQKFAACQPNKPAIFAFLNDQNKFVFASTDVPSYVIEDGTHYAYDSYKAAMDCKKKECASVLSGGRKKRRRCHKRRHHKVSCGGSVSSMSVSTAGSKKSKCSKASSVVSYKKRAPKKKKCAPVKRAVKTKQQKAREARLRAARAELRARTAELKCMSYQATAQPTYARPTYGPLTQEQARQNVHYQGTKW